jgi:predicted permease
MMRRLRAWVVRVAALAGRGRTDREIDDELETHRALLAAEYRRSGRSDEDARRTAAAAFGPIASTAAAYRDQRGIRRLEDLARDVREAARSLTRSRARLRRSVVVVALLAVCLTTGVAVFALVDGLLLKPLPFPDAERLFIVGPPSRLHPTRPGSVDFRDLDELRQSPGVDGAFSYDFDADRAKERFRPVRERRVSADFFDVLGVAPVLGRALGADDAGQQPRAVVIGYGLWQAALAGDPQMVGRVVSIGGDRVLVRGVMPRGFDFPSASTMWSIAPRVSPGPERMRIRSMAAVVRLARGANPAQLRLSGERVVAVSLADYLRPGDAWSILPVSCAALLLVVLGLTHLTAAQAAHALERARETAIRAALGSGWPRIARHWLIESALLTLAAVAIVVLAAPAVLAFVIRLLPTELSFGQPIAIDGRVVAMGGTVAGIAMTALAAVSVAVLQRGHLPDILRGRLVASRRGSVARARYVALGAQVAIVAGLVYVGALAWHSFVLANRADLGATAEGLLAIDWSDRRTPDAPAASRRDIAERVRHVPDVISVAFGPSPFEPNRTMLQFSRTPIRTFEQARAASVIEVRAVSPNYFTTAGIALVKGRPFEASRDDGDVVIVSQSLARRVFPNGSAVGQQVTIGGPARIIGVAADVRVMGPDLPPRALAYVPYRGGYLGGGLLVRFQPDVQGRVADITAIVRGAVPDASTVTVTDVATQRDHLLDAQRARATLLGLLGMVSFGLGIAGVFAMTAETVQRRLRDAAIRLALGASSASVMRQLVSSVLLVVSAGLLVGLVAGALGARAARGLFYSVRPSDPWTMATVVVVVLASAALAAIVPARRVARADVLDLLEDE